MSRILLGALLLALAFAGDCRPEEPKEPAPRRDRLGDPLPAGAIARLGTGRFHHASSMGLDFLKFSADAKSLVSRGGDHVCRVWEAETGRELYSFAVGDNFPLALTPNLRGLVVLDERGLQFWDVTTGKRVRTYAGAVVDPGPFAASRNGRRVAAQVRVKDEVQIRVWDSASGMPLKNVKLPFDANANLEFVCAKLFFTSRGRLIADLRRHHKEKLRRPLPVPQPDDDSLIVPAAYRDVQAGRNLHIPVSLLASTRPASFSPDARIVAAYEQGQAQSLLLVETSSGKTLRTLHLPVGRVLRTSFSPDSKTLATVSRTAPWVKRDRLRLWDVPSGKALPVTLDGAIVQAIAFAPDGRTVAVSTDDMVYVFDNATGRQRHAAKLASPVDDLALPSLGGPTALSNTIAFSPDGKLLAVAASMGQVRMWDMGTGKEILPSPDSHREPVRAVAVSSDGKRIASASTDGTLRVWDFQTGRRLQTLPLPSSADAPGPVPWDGFARYAVVFSHDGKLIAAASPFGTVRVWDAATSQQRRQIAVWPGGVTSLAITQDGQTLITGGYGRLLAWDVQTGKLTQTLANPPPAALEQGPVPFTTPTWKVAVPPDGRLVAGTSSLPGHDRERGPPGFQLRIWEMATGRLRRCLPPPRTGSPVAIGSDTRSAKFDLNDSDTQLCFAPDGKSLVWNEEGSLALLDVIHGNTLRSIGGSAANLRGIAFSPTGRLVATVSTTGRLRLYDPATGTLVGQASTLRGKLSCVAFSPDGKTLVTGGSDAAILLWNVGLVLEARHLGTHPVSAAILARWWQQLAHADGNEMATAMAGLEDRPERAVAWIHEHLRPAAVPSRARLSRLVAALDDARFAVRARAMRELENLAGQAGPFLRQRLAERPAPEARRRLTALLQHLNGPVRLPAQVRELRAIEILERIGTPKACVELRDLAGGDPNARLTQEAQTALERRRGMK